MNYWKLFLKLFDDGVKCLVVNPLAFWYSNQIAAVRWQSSVSSKFCIDNGVRQLGGVLSLCLLTRYIRYDSLSS